MREEDEAEGLTPADLRRRRRSGVLVFSLFLMVVLAGLAATVLAVNDGRNYRRLVQRLGLEHYFLAPPTQNIRVGRLKISPPSEHYPPWLIKAGLERAATFEAPETRTAEERCASLKTEKATEATFTPAGNDWECLFFQEFGSASEKASLFVQARGALPDTIRNFRIKLSLVDSTSDQAVIDEATAAIERFGLPMTPETRSYIKEMISTRREFTSIVETYRMTFSKEITDERRYNLLILPRPQTIKCGDAPETQPDSTATSVYRMPVGCLALRPVKGGPAS
ncbi:hypothetical protein KX729_03045 [Rhizobium sp. XQZ8]|uniref:DUF6030 family protein n=1 Tax=Rhizobium populisoli TaxID=2859785 RepID=UPI001C71E3A9|nr:DUF6030 family protein [Rhizobium populisoli]MBW6420404.1 hypothetical protein [Rhizobium populisoli]